MPPTLEELLEQIRKNLEEREHENEALRDRTLDAIEANFNRANDRLTADLARYQHEVNLDKITETQDRLTQLSEAKERQIGFENDRYNAENSALEKERQTVSAMEKHVEEERKKLEDKLKLEKPHDIQLKGQEPCVQPQITPDGRSKKENTTIRLDTFDEKIIGSVEHIKSALEFTKAVCEYKMGHHLTLDSDPTIEAPIFQSLPYLWIGMKLSLQKALAGRETDQRKLEADVPIPVVREEGKERGHELGSRQQANDSENLRQSTAQEDLQQKDQREQEQLLQKQPEIETLKHQEMQRLKLEEDLRQDLEHKLREQQLNSQLILGR